MLGEEKLPEVSYPDRNHFRKQRRQQQSGVERSDGDS
jgi:hypothetical protein